MLHTLHRLLPAPAARQLSGLVAWLSVAAALQGIALGLAGITVATCLDPAGQPGPWLAGLAAAVILFLVVQWAAQMAAFRVGSLTARALHLRLGEHLAELPLGWFTPTRQAQVIDLATGGIPQAMSYPAILLRPALTALITPVTAALTLALLDWRYTLAILAAAGIAWAVSRLSDRLARRVDAHRHQVGAEATRRILEYATRQPLIRTDQRPDHEALDHALNAVRAASQRSAATVIPGLLLFSVTLNALFAGLIGLGIAWTTGANLTIPVMLGILVVIARLTAVAAAGAELAAGLRLQRGILDRLANTLDTPPLPTLETPPASSGEADLVRVEDVSFAYGESPVLDSVSFTLPRRGLTAVVGPSGAGKTTLARLLARFWDPTTGRILLDGRDLRWLPPAEFAGHLATVLQDDYLLDASIGDNIRLARPDATSAELSAAVTAAALDPFLRDLPEGLDTHVGPGGSNLSGGQRQRVCVARALLKAAPLTLLDEATSALDPENARLIADAARRLATTGSVLVIAHNLDTIRRADQILVLDHGQLVEKDTHARLIERGGRYHALWHQVGRL